MGQTFTAIRLGIDGEPHDVQLAANDLLHELYRQIDCRVVAAVDLESGVTMWLDEEALINNNPEPNLNATMVAMDGGAGHQIYYGVAVFTGAPDADGETQPLSAENREWIRTTLGL